MKINSLVETTTSGSVASVSSPVGGMQKRAGSMFKGKKTSKPFYENKECDCLEDSCSCDKLEVKEGAMPASVIKVKEKIRMASDEENKERFAGKTKEELSSMARRHGYKDKNPYAKFHDGKTGITEGSISNALVAVEEARLSEEDLILMPGQGIRFKKELMPKKTDHEVEMARGQLYQSAKNAKDICDMLQGVSEMQGIDAWVQSKITTAADYLETVRAYMESKYEMQQEVDEATAREKFNKGLKQSGYDPHKGADRLLALIAKQAEERKKFEKELPLVYGNKDEVKEVASKFNSKQEVIQYFVSKGKSAASGAAAWERGWRGSKAKQKKLKPPVRSYHDDLDDKRYGEQSMEEATGDNPFDTMMKNIVKGAPKQATVDRKEQRKQNQDKARDAFSNMFGGGNPADKLSIRKKSVDEEKVRLDPKCWKGKHKEGTKMKGGVRVNNCVPNESIEEEKEGLWANIHAKRERIKHGSGERMRKPGSKGAPTADALKKSAKD